MKNKMNGWKEIFSFTFSQSIKTKSIKITTLILCILAILSMPVMTLVKGTDSNQKTTSIKKVLVVDATGLDLYKNMDLLKSKDLYEDKEEKLYTELTYEKADIQYDHVTEKTTPKEIYKFSKDSRDVYMILSYDQKQIGVQLFYSEKTKVKEKDVTAFSKFVEDHMNQVLMENQNISDEQKKIATSSVSIKYYDKNADDQDNAATNENGTNNKQSQVNTDQKNKTDYSGSKNNIIYAVLMIIMFILAFGGERVAMSIITEKSSKVMEFLLTSVKPMAIVIGKVLASLLILAIQAGLILASFGISILVSSFMNANGDKSFEIPSYLSKILNIHNFSGASPIKILIALCIFIAGFLFYGLIAGLAGASVSRIDEMSEGIKIYTILLVIGAYIAMFSVTQELYTGDSAFRYFVELFSVTSIFVTPSAIITGYVSIYEALLSLLIMIVSVGLLTKFVADVYESMVYYNGSPLKIKGILNISRENREKAKKNKIK